MLPTQGIHPGVDVEDQVNQVQQKLTECTVAFEKMSHLPSSDLSVYLRRKFSCNVIELTVL